ncbi:Zn-dependent alcohol dehydrogenase [Sphingomonas solaris]|uniref:Zn-dependent alcohol dehydrogenase n=1 Tax=Alterirhizorhabdus solaris TaxID=2529389 RepID=A0A558R7V5_9SPHN|nr:Zn-dependent alcohol dehydrogenase [Sphingomonas solaris]TVV75460.1 Zn-dependent alcohol dehydrogenase [Sphingomonas solaris]
MKAAILRAAREPLTIETVELDGPRPEEVRIRVAGSGLCHSDYHVMSGDLGSPFPIVLGHEASGIVEAVGSDVRGLAPGDRVVTCTSIYCGHCGDCQDGHNHLCSDKPVRPQPQTNSPIRQNGEAIQQFCNLGAFAEEMIVHRSAVSKLPEGMPLDVAAVLGCAVLTGIGSVTAGADVKPGSKVVVLGCGGVGLNVVQGARLAGAAQIIAVDLNPAKLELARAFGATDVVLGGEGAVERVIEATGGGADYAFEVIGIPAVQRQAFMMLRKRGTLMIVGITRMDAELSVPALALLGKEIRIIGSNMGSVPFQRVIPTYAQLYLDGRLTLDPLISQRIALEQINEGYEQLIAGETARSVIVFDH